MGSVPDGGGGDEGLGDLVGAGRDLRIEDVPGVEEGEGEGGRRRRGGRRGGSDF